MTVSNFSLTNFSSALFTTEGIASHNTSSACNSACCTPQVTAEKLYTCDRCDSKITTNNLHRSASVYKIEDRILCDFCHSYLYGEITDFPEKLLEEDTEEKEDNTIAMIACDHCSDRTDPDETYPVNLNGCYRSVCSDCLDSDYTMCMLNGEYYENDEIVETGRFQAYHITEEQRDRAGVSDRYRYIQININPSNSYEFCECNDCNDYFPNDCMNNTNNDNVICDHCREDDYFTCCNCDYLFHNDNYGEDGYCENCAEENKEESLIKDYSYNVLKKLEFQGKANDGIYFGVELETNSNYHELEGNAEIVQNLLEGYALLKEDSSIGVGFEIVTAPATLEVHLEKLALFAEKRPKYLNSYESGNCGMHVHVSRKPLGNLAIGKILKFVGSETNRSFITTIAGRGQTHWCELSEKKITDCKKHLGRYTAVNTTNQSTIEFRIFRGTLDKIHLLANVEFVHAVTYYCLQASMQKLHYHDFLAWVLKQSKYKNLHKFLENKGY